MPNRVGYEWDLETWDGTGPEAEVVDHHHGDTLKTVPWPSVEAERLVLVRDEDGGERLWAYVDHDSKMLPKFFSKPTAGGDYAETQVAVPQRFHREIARAACGRY